MEEDWNTASHVLDGQPLPRALPALRGPGQVTPFAQREWCLEWAEMGRTRGTLVPGFS